MSDSEHLHSHLHHVDDIADDPPPRFTRKRVDETEMDITPMIDITFLLLIFFLVASHMESQAAVPLPEARYGATVGVKESVIITLAPGEADTARVFKGDGSESELEIGSINLLEQEEELIKYIEDEMARGVPRKHHVLIKAARGVKHRDVARIAKSVGKVEKVQQLHIAVLEQN
jgi:biopolymer transport protein TolR